MKKINQKRLRNIALYYVGRYETTCSHLRAVLHRRLAKEALKQEIPPEASDWIEQIIQDMVQMNYINEKRFTENTTRRLSEAGKSCSFIRAKLKSAGIDEDEIADALSDTDELTSARLFVQKKHLGHDFKRNLARLARAGFTYDTACQALSEVCSMQDTSQP